MYTYTDKQYISECHLHMDGRCTLPIVAQDTIAYRSSHIVSKIDEQDLEINDLLGLTIQKAQICRLTEVIF